MSDASHKSVPEWAKVDAVKRLNRQAGDEYYRLPGDHDNHSVLVVARLIAAHEEAPVDPLLIEAREIASNHCKAIGQVVDQDDIAQGYHDDAPEMHLALAALRRGIEIGGAK